jgi:hypothetical protein
VSTLVVFDVTSPHDTRVAFVFSTMASCCPITVALDAVSVVPVVVPVVALPAVNGDPVASLKFAVVGNAEP